MSLTKLQRKKKFHWCKVILAAFLLPFDVKSLFCDKSHEPRFVQLLRNIEAHDYVRSEVS